MEKQTFDGRTKKYGTLLSDERLEQIINAVKKSQEQLNNYKITQDELFGYSCISPSESGLKVRIFVDDSSSYKHYDHSLYIFFINSYDEESTDLVPIGQYGAIGNEVEVKISQNDLEDIRSFVKLNSTNILKLANEEIDIVDFSKLMIPLTK